MRKNEFMRQFYRLYYEDPLYELTEANPDCRMAIQQRKFTEDEFLKLIDEKCPELLEVYEHVIAMYLHFERQICEEFYILGVQDRDRALMEQI